MSNTIKSLNKKLREEINIILDEDFEKIVKCINLAVKKYDNKNIIDSDKIWREILKIIKEQFYIMFERVYKKVNKYLKKMYGTRIPDIKIKDLSDLLYNEDGKTFEERVNEHWVEGRIMLLDNESKDKVKRKLHNDYNKIAISEVRSIESHLKEMKKPLTAEILVIESGCDKCEGGEYPADEDIPLPPYHPCCNCSHYYEETDLSDEIEDLDLDGEE